MKNFFNAIGVADMEKVHSAVIGWMLSDDCEAFDIKSRSKLLQDLFKIPPKEQVNHFNSIESFLEWKNIDILIITTTENGQQCWVLENKIKSSQHSDQLNRYVDIINCKYLLSSKNYKQLCDIKNSKGNVDDFLKGINRPKDNKYANISKKHFCFLTLINELPICNRENANWVNSTYSELYKSLETVFEKSTQQGHHKTIVSEYLDCVNILTKVFEDFTKNYCSYVHVFEDTGKTKEEKLNLTYNNDNEKYVCENGLETIFQKCFLGLIEKQYKQNTSSLYSQVNWEIGESSLTGTATVIIPLNDICDCQAQIEFQNGSFKLQFKSDKIKKDQFVQLWKSNLGDIVVNTLDKVSNQKWSVNLPKNNSHRSFISISNKAVETEGWFKKSLDDIVKVWEDNLKSCENVFKEITQKVNPKKSEP